MQHFILCCFIHNSLSLQWCDSSPPFSSCGSPIVWCELPFHMVSLQLSYVFSLTTYCRKGSKSSPRWQFSSEGRCVGLRRHSAYAKSGRQHDGILMSWELMSNPWADQCRSLDYLRRTRTHGNIGFAFDTAPWLSFLQDFLRLVPKLGTYV